MIRRTALSFAALVALLPALATAQVPQYVNFQSVLRDDSGNLVEDGFVDLTFKILDQDGDELYAEVQPGVQVVRSAVNVMIGEGAVPGSSPSAPTGGIPFDTLDPNQGSHFLQIQFGSNLPSDPMELGSVPYAMYAEKALKIDFNIGAGDIPPIFLTTSTDFSGDVSGNYNNLQLGAGVVGPGELAPTGVSAGSYTHASITVDEDGRITAASSGSIVTDHGALSGLADDDHTQYLERDGSDSMSGSLNMGGNNITNVGSGSGIGFTVADHEGRIAALESEPPAASARAWVNWSVNGSGVITILSSFNVNGVTNGGNTDFAITFTSSMSDAQYMMTGSGEDPSDIGGGGAMMICMNTSKNTASTAYIKGVDKNGNLQYNNRNYRVVFFR